MSNRPMIRIASTNPAVAESLQAWCKTEGIGTSEAADLWLIDGHHPPASIPKQATLIVLGHIPQGVTPAHTIPTPATLEDIRRIVQQQMQSVRIALRNGWMFEPQQRSLVHSSESAISLTEKEAGLLQHLLHATPEEIGREEVLKNLWAYDKDVDTHTLETHIYRLRQKIGNAPLEIVTTEHGYKVAL